MPFNVPAYIGAISMRDPVLTIPHSSQIIDVPMSNISYSDPGINIDVSMSNTSYSLLSININIAF
jgi:hypothetical protein